MRAVSPGRAAVQDMDTDHVRLYVAIAEKFLDRADIVALPSGCVADKWPLWVICGRMDAIHATPAKMREVERPICNPVRAYRAGETASH